jgi:septal ring factor EnvC (AmiA/AmiB activator)
MLTATQADGGSYLTLLIAIAAVVAVVISVMVWRTQRKASTDANTIAGEATRIAQRQLDLDTREATIENLRIDLAAAQEETKKLRDDLASARTETRRLTAETTTALANVSILSDFIRDHAPEVPFPRLRRVPDVG